MEEAVEWADGTPLPQAIVDAGGEHWAVLGDTIMRRLSHMAIGEILEIVSQERRNRADIPVWCDLSGHELLHMITEGESTRFRIRKGQTDWRDRAEGENAV